MARAALLVSFATALVASAAVAACTLFVPIDDASGETPAAGTDGGTDGSAAAGANVNEAFEGSEPGCGARWGPALATAERVADGHTGAACRICRDQKSSVYMILNDQIWRPEQATGRKYRVDGWLRWSRGNPEMAGFEIVYDVEGESEPRLERTYVRPLPTTWTRFEATLTVPDEGTNVRFRVRASSPVLDACVDIDDVSVTRGM